MVWRPQLSRSNVGRGPRALEVAGPAHPPGHTSNSLFSAETSVFPVISTVMPIYPFAFTLLFCSTADLLSSSPPPRAAPASRRALSRSCARTGCRTLQCCACQVVVPRLLSTRFNRQHGNYIPAHVRTDRLRRHETVLRACPFRLLNLTGPHRAHQLALRIHRGAHPGPAASQRTLASRAPPLLPRPAGPSPRLDS